MDVSRWTIMALLLVVAIGASLTLSKSDIDRYTVHPNDRHACLWFKDVDGNTIHRCCDGYKKNNTNGVNGNCTECPNGLYGFLCQNKCACNNGVHCNNIDGTCQCPEGYFGQSCEKSCNCQNGARCNLDGSCSCLDGYYGILCQSQCQSPTNKKCRSDNGNCVCKDGYYGHSCIPCNCSSNEKCNPNDGTCQCVPGFFGDTCSDQCSCYNGGTCENGISLCHCQLGWTNSNCTDCDNNRISEAGQYFCDKRCLHCYNGDTCSIENGNCLCTPGWQGNKCDKKCNAGFYGMNCSEFCPACDRGSCNNVDGTCSCEHGWTGDYCQNRCPENCLTCQGDRCKSCKPGFEGANCTSSCKAGVFGESCTHQCKCNCTNTCNAVNGSCPEFVRCEDDSCKCKNGGSCVENTFECECLDGWNGPSCDNKTPTTIIQGTSFPSFSLTNTSSERNGSEEDGQYISTLSACVIVICCIILSVAIIAASVCLKKRNVVLCNKAVRHANGAYITTQQNHELDTFDGYNVPDASRKSANNVVTVCKAESKSYMNGMRSCNKTIENGRLSTENHDREEEKGNRAIKDEESECLTLHELTDNLNSKQVKKIKFEGPYSIVAIPDLKYDSDSSSETNDTAYNILDKIGYKKQQKQQKCGHNDYDRVNRMSDSDTDDHEYELLQQSYKFDNRKT